MNSQKMYEALLAHLANVSEEELVQDWEALKEFNCGVSISEYLETVALLTEVSLTELETTKITSKFDGTFVSLNCKEIYPALAA